VVVVVVVSENVNARQTETGIAGQTTDETMTGEEAEALLVVEGGTTMVPILILQPEAATIPHLVEAAVSEVEPLVVHDLNQDRQIVKQLHKKLSRHPRRRTESTLAISPFLLDGTI
jgi:hypothetical protein